jgi:predicted acyltransferase
MEEKKYAAPQVPAAARVLSVDALRGFDMFWIVGADQLARSIGKDAAEGSLAHGFASQLRHVGWEGFVFYDLIFPLFVFLLGMSTVFSLPKYVEQHGKGAAYAHIFRRFILLFLLGAFRDAGLSDLAGESPFSGVLQRMAWCYLGAALIFLNFRLKAQAAIFFAILIGYWALLTFVPHPELGAAGTTFERKENFVDWVDYKFLPMKEEGQYAESEGLLSTLPAVASALLGIFAATVLRSKRIGDLQRVGVFIGAGVVLVALGYLWGLQFPIIKKIWTSSFVLVAGGYSCILLGIFYAIVDVYKAQRWCVPLIWIGANPLMIYMCSEFIDFEDIAKRLAGGPVAGAFGVYSDLFINVVSIVVVFAFARFLYVRKLFLRV